LLIALRWPTSIASAPEIIREKSRLDDSHDLAVVHSLLSFVTEAAEAALYRLLQERLKSTTIISIGHRSTLGAFRRRRVVLVPDEDRYRVREVPLVSAAE